MKFKFPSPITWQHHRSGWKWVVSAMQERFSTPDGVFVHTFADRLFHKEIILQEPWIGFLHSAPTIHPLTKEFYGHSKLLCLEAFLPIWDKITANCLGLFVFTDQAKAYLNKPRVWKIVHPTQPTDKKFDMNLFNHQLVLIGHWMRNWQDIFDLPVTKLQKYILQGTDIDYLRAMEVYRVRVNDSVSFLPRLNDDGFDNLLQRCVVFLPLYDCAACNTLLECVARNTPVLLPKLAGAVEYLGEHYPLYYSSLGEATAKVQDEDLLRKTNEYLADLDKRYFDLDYFLDQYSSSFDSRLCKEQS